MLGGDPTCSTLKPLDAALPQASGVGAAGVGAVLSGAAAGPRGGVGETPKHQSTIMERESIDDKTSMIADEDPLRGVLFY